MKHFFAASKQIACLLLLLSLSFALPARQTKEEMEQKRKANQEQIKKISRILNQTTQDKYSSLDQLKAINRQLFRRKDLLKNIREELVYIEEEIQETSMVIKALKRDLDGLLKEYKIMVYTASKSADSFQRLSYLFSSKSFNQFLSRVSYMNQYHAARQNQINQINKIRGLLEEKNVFLLNRLQEQEELIETERKQNEQLSQLRQRQSELIVELRKKESQLRRQLSEEKRLRKQLSKLVASSVAAQIEEDAKAENPENNPKGNERKEVKGEATRIFELAKGKLRWPVEEGFISGKFGLHPHPVIKDVQVENIGVDIRTNNEQPVLSVFQGKVTAVTKFSGMNYLVMLQHGNYFTVYANLSKVEVTNGEEVAAGTVLGTVYTNQERISELQFQIWQNDRNLDPEAWLKE